MAKGVRRQGRELALKLIYSLSDHEGGSLEAVLEDFWGNFRFRNDILGDALEVDEDDIRPEVRSFAETLVSGVSEHLEEIDAAINAFSTNWTLDRMARVDLALLRLAGYELLYCPDVPASVIINEAIEIGKRFGTRDTKNFINGVLDQISKSHRPTAP
jgi:N utilization substance protein B